MKFYKTHLDGKQWISCCQLATHSTNKLFLPFLGSWMVATFIRPVGSILSRRWLLRLHGPSSQIMCHRNCLWQTATFHPRYVSRRSSQARKEHVKCVSPGNKISKLHFSDPVRPTIPQWDINLSFTSQRPSCGRYANGLLLMQRLAHENAHLKKLKAINLHMDRYWLDEAQTGLYICTLLVTCRQGKHEKKKKWKMKK